jgi:UDP-N-acetylglucosamine 2-epimerase
VKKFKVMTIVGTRPEIIRLSCVISLLDKKCEHTLVHTGQNYDYELNQIFFDDLKIRMPDYFLEAAGNNGSETIGKVIILVDKLLKSNKPDAILILGDTNSCMAALPAKRNKIPIFHMEAGNRCFDMRVPEEINRKLVDHIADMNLTYSSIAREYLLSEGFAPDRVIKIGSPMLEVLTRNEKFINESNILNKLGLKENEFFLVSSHREENIDSDKNFYALLDMLNGISDVYNFPVIVSTHPRTEKRIKESKIKLNKNIQLLKPLGFHDYNKLQISSKVCLSDSGTISEESSILNFPALNIREAHERPEAMEESSVMMVGMSFERIIQGIEILASQKRGEERTLDMVDDYSSKNVSEKVLRIIISYTDYINRVVWKKY